MMHNSGKHPLLAVGSISIRMALVALVTLLALEALLQLAFPRLPSRLIEQMPQYRERLEFRLETEYGAREYPAGQTVDFEISMSSGDLFQLTCLSPKDAVPFDPYRVTFTRDAHGFRNLEPWPERADLVVIGDSFTAAENIVEPFWHGIVDSLLVLGLPGSGTLEQQRILEAFALPREPKAVVLAYFAGNDLEDNLLFADMMKRGESFADRAHKDKTPLDYSVLFNLLLALRNTVKLDNEAPCHYPQLAQTSPATPVALYDKFLPLLMLDRELLRESKKFELTRASIDEMASQLNSIGSELILMYIPQKAELYWNFLSDESKELIFTGINNHQATTGPDSISNNLSVQRDMMAELADELDIPFLDLTFTLSEAINGGQQSYFFADTHWNQTGHNLARIALLDFMNQSNLDV